MSRIAVFTTNNVGFCFTRTSTELVKAYSGSIETAAKAFAKDVPPSSVCAIYVECSLGCDFATLKRFVPAVQSAGFKNVVVYSRRCAHFSMALNLMNVECQVGDTVALLRATQKGDTDEGHGAIIVKKVANGYETLLSVTALKKDIKSINSLQHAVVIVKTEISEEQKAVFQKTYAEFFKGKEEGKFHFILFDDDDHLGAFVWNKYDGGDFNGNLLAEVVELSFEYSDKKVHLCLDAAKLPYSNTFQIDIFKAEFFEVNARFTNKPIFLEGTLFDGSKRRIIETTVSIGLDFVPEVKVKTTECENVQLIRPEGKSLNNTALRIVASNNRVVLCVVTSKLEQAEEFHNYPELITYLLKWYPPHKVEAVVELYSCDLTIKQRRECRLQLQKAGYAHIISKDAGYLWLDKLHRYKVKVADGETVAVSFDQIYCILARQGQKFRVLHFANIERLVETMDLYRVGTVITNYPTNQNKCAISCLGNRFIIVEDSGQGSKYICASIWNLCDGLNVDGFFVDETMAVVFKVSWSRKNKTFETGFVPIPYTWTVELDVGDAPLLQVDAKLFYAEAAQTQFSEINAFDIAKLGTGKVALTFCINSAHHVAARCVPLPPGHIPRPVSLCLLIERTANGFKKTVYFRVSGNVVIDNYSTLNIALETFKQAKHAAIVFNVLDTTAAEREEWRLVAMKRGFKEVQFVNGSVLTLNSFLLDVDVVDFGDNETVLVADMTAVDKNGQKTPITYVLHSCQEKKLKLQKISQAKVDKVYSTVDSVHRVFIATDGTTKPQKLPAYLNPVFLTASNESLSKFLFSRVDDDVQTESIVPDFSGITFHVEWNGAKHAFSGQYDAVPFSREVALHVGPVKSVKILTTLQNSKKRELLEALSFDTTFDRVVVLNFAIDITMVPSVTVIRSYPIPATVFEFTPDNRVIVHSDAVDSLQYPAYVHFGDVVLVGETALACFKVNPETVVYDVHRFFAPDFDPSRPDPSWHFKTSRGKNDETTIRIGESETSPVVCFGLIVSAVKRDVESSGNCTLTDIGIRMPFECHVPQNAVFAIGDKLNIKLFVFN